MPAVLFSGETEAAVLDSVRKLREIWEAARQSAYTEYMDFFLGGKSRMEKYLVRHAGEVDFEERLKRCASPNYVGSIAQALIDGLYGDPVARQIESGASDEQKRVFESVYRYNRWDERQKELAQGIVVLGDAFANTAYDERARAMVLTPLHPGCLWWETDPARPGRILRLVERRLSPWTDADGKPLYTWWVWTPEWFTHLDPDLKPLRPRTANPYKTQRHPDGLVPYIRYKGRAVLGVDEGASYIEGLVDIQKMALNRMSDHDLMIVYQAHGVLVTVGYMQDEALTGPTTALNVGPNGDAKFISPGAQIAPVGDTIDKLFEYMHETGQVPVSIVRGGTANSGVQLQMEMRPYTRVVGSERTSALASEIEMAEAVCAIGAYHGLKLPVDAEFSIGFADNVLPVDKDAEFDRDFRAISAKPPLMTLEKFVRKWAPEEAKTEDSLKKYITELRAEQDQSAQRDAAAFGGGTHEANGFLAGAGAGAVAGDAGAAAGAGV